MHISIRRQLEGRLSSEALNYLNEEFRKAEKTLIKLKELEMREKYLLEELAKKEEKLWSIFSKSSGNESGSKQPMGYQYGGLPKEYYMNPEEEYERGYSIPQFEMRRGGNRGIYARRGVPGSAYIPNIEPAERRYMPFQTEAEFAEFEMARGDGSSSGGSSSGGGSSR